jgi:hypothetical protein
VLSNLFSATRFLDFPIYFWALGFAHQLAVNRPSGEEGCCGLAPSKKINPGTQNDTQSERGKFNEAQEMAGFAGVDGGVGGDDIFVGGVRPGTSDDG